MNNAAEYRTQRLDWFVEIGIIDGGGIGRWEETTETVQVPSQEAAEKLRDEWEASGKLQRTQWGELRVANNGYGIFRIRSQWVDDLLPATDAQALANPKVQALVEAVKDLIGADGPDYIPTKYWNNLRADLAALENPDG